MRPLLLACLLSAAGGCALRGRALYLPAVEATASLSGYPAACYEIPPEAPRGGARVASFGVAWVRLRGHEPVRAVHARLLVANADDEGIWDLDVRDLRVTFPSGESSDAWVVNATAQGLPVLQVPPGRQVSVDAYFPVPSWYGEQGVPGYDLAWKVETPERAVEEETSFERRRTALSPGITVVFGHGLGFSPYWWFDGSFFPSCVAGFRPPRVYLGYPGRR